MKIETLILVFIIVIVVVFTLKKLSEDNQDSYRYLGNLYSPLDGGFATEYNEECMNNENAHCMMTNGMTGKCILNGQCMASAMVDARQEAEEVHKPYCTRPYSGDACGRFCDCLAMSGQTNSHESCLKECKSWFHPYFRNSPY